MNICTFKYPIQTPITTLRTNSKSIISAYLIRNRIQLVDKIFETIIYQRTDYGDEFYKPIRYLLYRTYSYENRKQTILTEYNWIHEKIQMNKTNRPALKKKNLQQFMKRNHNFVRIDVEKYKNTSTLLNTWENTNDKLHVGRPRKRKSCNIYEEKLQFCAHRYREIQSMSTILNTSEDKNDTNIRGLIQNKLKFEVKCSTAARY